jgi:hypothetical protein
MKKINIAYWIFTGVLAAFMLMSAITNIMVIPAAVTLMKDQLGYPVYIIPFIGVAKLLGVIAILVPRFPRLKEWAYAGFVIDLTGATYSTIAVGEPVTAWGFMFVFFAIVAGSYIFYHKMQKTSVAGTVKIEAASIAV